MNYLHYSLKLISTIMKSPTEKVGILRRVFP